MRTTIIHELRYPALEVDTGVVAFHSTAVQIDHKFELGNEWVDYFDQTQIHVANGVAGRVVLDDGISIALSTGGL